MSLNNAIANPTHILRVYSEYWKCNIKMITAFIRTDKFKWGQTWLCFPVHPQDSLTGAWAGALCRIKSLNSQVVTMLFHFLLANSFILAKKNNNSIHVDLCSHLVCYRAEGARPGFSAEMFLWGSGHSNLYELSSICSVKFDVEGLAPSSLAASRSRPPGFPHFIAHSQSSGNRSLLTA